ncbi:TlpA disulfide reductase family protein [Telluribacter sp.]|jgi:thiol-disulfide isomerase/thioredoxin|uniref:TlpA family protein disulfide reductase n=1 Tax=Telluribacter sp. TaxID=1978767 RepID=UPI002E0D54F7|nr:TlpA disulfide reductase family protein [Telluribacter sp.]
MKISLSLSGLLISLCLHSLTLHAQDTVRLAFSSNSDFRSKISRSGLMLEKTDQFAGIPDAVEWSVFVMNLQRQQSTYTNFKKGYYTEEQYQKIVNLYKHDTVNVYKGKDIKNALPVLSALFPDNRKLIIPDLNFNNDFGDDKVYEYRVTDFDAAFPIDSIETLKVDYDYYYGDKIYKRQLLFKISPTTQGSGFTDSKEKRLQVKFVTDESRSARVALGGIEYEFKIGLAWDVAADYGQARAVYVKDVQQDKIISYNPLLKLGKFFPLGEKQVKIDNVSYFGDSALLIVENAETATKGTRQGEQLPDSTQQVLHKVLNQKTDYTLIDFWGSWCGPCIKALPDLQKVHTKYKDNPNFQLVSVAYEQSRDLKALNNLVGKHNITWQNIVEYQPKQGEVYDYNRLVSHFSVEIFPTTVLLDKQGRIIYRDSGSDSFERLNEVLKRELGY